MKKYVFILCTALTFSACEPLRIDGLVVDRNMAPVAGATIMLSRTDTTVVTGNTGKFSLPVKVQDTIVIKAPGFEPAERVLNFIGGNTMTIILKKKK